MGDLNLPKDTIADITSRLELRAPNTEAISTLAAEVSKYYAVDQKQPPLEAVIVSAPGVGKTFILAGSMELFVKEHGIRDFVIVTPGRTILEKTRHNFTPGHPKSVLGHMSFQPKLITAENFTTAMQAVMDDNLQVKVYLFTVQSLIRPKSETDRKTRKFHEGLGKELYAHLQGIKDLVVFADEHHIYYGQEFSRAVRELNPWVLVGLTATPHEETPTDKIIFRYPLAAAIADKLVKTPVLVGRTDDRSDPLTKLTDGVTLLRAKAESLSEYTQRNGLPPVNPVMLVVAKNIEEAEEFGNILRSSDFFGGAYADAVLVIHSNAPDEALAALDTVEDPDSSVRIIISVGMLKEGWDVKNVYVIASMRASVSEILTEQTLGRGMRLPFGEYTNIEFLDTLEVIAHERYEYLLNKAGILNQEVIDYRTRAALHSGEQGQPATADGTEPRDMTGSSDDGSASPVSRPTVPPSPAGFLPPSSSATVSQLEPVIFNMEARAQQAKTANERIKQQITRRSDAPQIMIPVLKLSSVKSNFSLADITDMGAFRHLGEKLSANPDWELNRTLMQARVVIGANGIKRTEVVRKPASDHIKSAASLIPLDDITNRLTEMILSAPAVQARKNQKSAVERILEAFFEGLGDNAQTILSSNLETAGYRLVELVTNEQKRFMVEPSFEEEVELCEFNPIRMTDREIDEDRLGPFSKAKAYGGWNRSLFPVEWFDSSPERSVANMVDDDDTVRCWVRLHIGELPIPWRSTGQEYHPDLIVIENDGTHWIVEVKMDREMTSADVREKGVAARRWVNYVNDSGKVDSIWKYLLVSEKDVEDAKGSWKTLKDRGSYTDVV